MYIQKTRESQGDLFGVGSWWTCLALGSSPQHACLCLLLLCHSESYFLVCDSSTVSAITQFWLCNIQHVWYGFVFLWSQLFCTKLSGKFLPCGVSVCLSQQSWDWPLWKVVTIEGVWIRLEHRLSGQMLNSWELVLPLNVVHRLRTGYSVGPSSIKATMADATGFESWLNQESSPTLLLSPAVLQSSDSFFMLFFLTFQFPDLDHRF